MSSLRSGNPVDGEEPVGMCGVVGMGTDLVEIPRFRRALERRARFGERLFSEAERAYAARSVNPAPRLAARFAAKEAVMKALGVGLGAFALRDVEVVRQTSGAPEIVLTGKAAELAERRGVHRWHLSLTHSESMAMAVALAVGEMRDRTLNASRGS